MENTSQYINKEPHVYTGEEITLVLGAIGALIASLIYALKNVNHVKSGCCECNQEVDPVIIHDHLEEHGDNKHTPNISMV